MAGAVQVGLQIAAAAMESIAVGFKIEEAITDYAQEISDLKEMRNARLAEMTASGERAKEAGIAGLQEKVAGANFDTRMATMKAEMTASGSEAKMAASGVRAGGSALMGAQQNVDIAYAAADRVAEAGTAGVRIGGLQLADTLQSSKAAKSLLTLEYGQTLAEQKKKKENLQKSKGFMIAATALGAGAGVASSFYEKASTKSWGWEGWGK